VSLFFFQILHLAVLFVKYFRECIFSTQKPSHEKSIPISSPLLSLYVKNLARLCHTLVNCMKIDKSATGADASCFLYLRFRSKKKNTPVPIESSVLKTI